MADTDAKHFEAALVAFGGAVAPVLVGDAFAASPLGPPSAWSATLRATLGLVLRASAQIVLFWGPDFIALYNDSYAPTIGGKHPHALGEPARVHWAELWSDLGPLLQGVRDTGQTFAAKDRPFYIERHGYGETVYFDVSYSAVLEVDGSVGGVLCIVSETTARVLAEARLKDSRDRLQALLSTSFDQIYRMSADWRDIRLLESRSPTEAAAPGQGGVPYAADPADQEKVRAAIELAIRDKAAFDLEHRVERADGAVGWTHLRAVPMLDECGEIREWFGAARDITEAKAAAETLRQLNATLERRIDAALAEKKLMADIVENMDSLLQAVDCDFRWLAFNDAFAAAFFRDFGVRPEPGRSLLDALCAFPESRARMQAGWQRALAGEAFTLTSQPESPTSAAPVFEVRFSPLFDAEGKVLGAYQFAQDITQRLADHAQLAAAQEALRQSQKMETIGQLTGGVAHDFNNLLTPIIGALELMGRNTTDPRMKRLGSAGLQAAERARVLIQRLLLFSRRQHLDPKPVDLCRILLDLADMIARSLGPAIRLLMRCPPDLPMAQVDPNQLELAILNLAVNARDAMPEGGTLTIDVGFEAQPKSAKPAPLGYLCIRVTDTGTGMDEATLSRAVEPFFTTKSVGRGTGLGLSSVHGLAAQSGGDFALASAIGEGTTATLWLPVAAASAAPADAVERASESGHARGTAVVLLVDDEDFVRIGTRHMLIDAGYRVLEARSADEALLIARDRIAFDALITDFAMPGMNGVVLAAEIREVRPDLPVLLITGFASGPDAIPDDFVRLEKPYRQRELTGALAALLETCQTMPDAIPTSPVAV